MKRYLLIALILAGCQSFQDAGGTPTETELDPDDSLAFEEALDPESFDALHREVIQPSCAAVEAFCHAGQFEPNLSTASLAYASLVNRPGIELFDRQRVTPGDASNSLLIDKLRNRAGVATIMPLGAPPMANDDIARVEQWIKDGALRHPDADPAPALNESPMPPEVAIYDAAGLPLTMGATVQVGNVITLRHSVRDYETEDDAIAFGGFSLLLADGRNVYFGPVDGAAYPSAFDALGPMGVGDDLNWTADWAVPDMLAVLNDAGTDVDVVPAAGETLTLLAFVLDQSAQSGGIVALGFEASALQIGVAP